MRKIVFVTFMAMALSCGDDEPSQVEACNQVMDILCDKFFSCYTKEQLDAAQSVVGLNAADCKVKFKAKNCGVEEVKCDAGETYHGDKAKQCVDAFRDLSCNNIRMGTITEAAVCKQVCTN
jgi:hypothetical protein